ncbi:MAG TPA: efflux RND transporter periplasmic adaptor subunit [Pirellulales bacterium]|jgi:RND family efflux transporter MFP subunit|nr:efflux RND transporter periplasmic adaptor subunit [Pirellulales bacterium]
MPVSQDTMVVSRKAVPSTSLHERRTQVAGQLHDDLAALRIDRTRRPRLQVLRFFEWLLLPLALAGGAGAAYGRYEDHFRQLKEQLQPALAVETNAVRRLSINQKRAVLTATGNLESRRQTAVGDKGAGRIARLHFEEGTKVCQGDLLAVLEHNDLIALLESREVTVEQAQADFGRERNVNRKGAGTRAALETSETDFKTAKARLEAMAAAVWAAEAHVREAEVAIRYMHVYAPFNATVISKDAEVGETTIPGGMGAASGRGSVATLADLNALEVDADVKEGYLAKIRRGQPADVLVDAVPDRRFRGRLREIVAMADYTRGIVKDKVDVLDADERLFPELSATVHFLPEADEKTAGDATQALYLPATAVLPAQPSAFVWRLTGERAEQVSVTLVGEPRDGLVQVEGGMVLTDPPADLSGATKVRAP